MKSKIILDNCLCMSLDNGAHKTKSGRYSVQVLQLHCCNFQCAFQIFVCLISLSVFFSRSCDAVCNHSLINYHTLSLPPNRTEGF